jgi:class 3 adenylate cyclase/predicted ATPase
MPSPWLAYVPQHVAQDILAHPHANPTGREQRFEAVGLFADVSGFTAMSEALGAASRAGAEELTAILNDYFGPMIDLVQSYSGIVGKFGGDALTVLFPYTRRTQAATLRRAIQCALDMQAIMPRYESIVTRAGEFNLAMKAGLALGPVLCVTVGDPEVRLEYLIAGGVLDRCADAEHHATRGEVVIHTDLRDALGDGALDIVEERDGFSRVAGLRRRARSKPAAPPPPVPDESPGVLARFVHPAIAQRLQAGQIGFINEHRKASVLFVSFAEFDYDADPSVGAKLQRYLTEAIRIIQRYDGYLNKVDMGDKGSKYIVLFGAPVAHEDDEERAVRCALELSALPDRPTRIGINTGFVYCGQVGSDARREYTVIGDAVNLAARLMQAARPGQILVSGATRQHIAAEFDWEALDPITVKGKSEPVEVYAAREVREQPALPLREPAYALPLVGRERELRQAEDAIERARQGRGQVIGLCAEAGIGKSRLAAEVIKRAVARGLIGYGGACQSYGAATPYLVWRDIWRGFFGVQPGWPPERQAQHLAAQLAAIDLRLAQRAPLLGVVLNVETPDNELTRSLDAQLRADLLKSLLLDCLRHRARTTPLVLALEDCHWIDSLSQELLEFIGRNVADLPVLLLVLYRPPEGEGGPLQWAAGAGHFGEIRLAELESSQAEQLTRLKLKQLWGIEGEAPQAIEQLVARTQGNPFYLEEMLNYLHDRGLDPRDEQALKTLDVPDSLRSLIISRIDQLPEAAKTTLKVASVIGRQFLASWLWGSYPPVGAPAEVLEYLQALSRLDLTPLNKLEPEAEYLFKHITTQEVAYDSLTFAMRADLHERVGQYAEGRYADRLVEYVDVLAHHYGLSHNSGKQRVYFRQAGDAARAAYANQAAIEYYRRLLDVLAAAEQSEVLLDLGAVQQLTGQWPEAEATYRQALAQAADNRNVQARCRLALGSLLSRTQSYTDALDWLAQAQAGFEQLGDRRGVGRAMEQLSLAYFHQGDFARALECAEQQLQIATQHDDSIGVSAALDYMGITFFQQEDMDRALEHLLRALDVASAAGHKRGVVVAYNDLAAVHWRQDDYPRAVEYLRRSIEVAGEIGYLQMIGLMLGNAGTVYQQLGSFAAALACYGQALRIAAELGDWPGILNVIGNVALVFTAQSRYEEAGRLYARAIDLARSLNIPHVLCADLQRAAQLHHLQGRHAEASPLNREALEVARQVGRREYQFEAEVLAIRLRVAVNEIDAARAIGELEALSSAWPDENEQAALYYETWRLDRTRETARQAAASFYRSQYAGTFDVEYRQRYTELTGETLPDPPALPPMPEEVMKTPVNLDALLKRVGVELEPG